MLKILQRYLTQQREYNYTMQFEWIETILTIPTKYQPLGEIPRTNLPPFSNICRRYARWSMPLIGTLYCVIHSCPDDKLQSLLKQCKQ